MFRLKSYFHVAHSSLNHNEDMPSPATQCTCHLCLILMSNLLALRVRAFEALKSQQK